MGNGREKKRPFIGVEQRSIAHDDRAGSAPCRAARADDRASARKSPLRPQQTFFSTEKKNGP